MDLDRFRTRERELRALAERVAPLEKMLDRVTAADLKLVTDLATKAADSFNELLKADPPGCTCRLIETDNYSYLDYAESCRHHRQYHRLREELKEGYARMEKALKNEVRLKLVAAALTGTASSITTQSDAAVVERAFAIADEAIRQIAGESA